MHLKIRKGLDIPLAGVPEQIISNANAPRSVALLGPDTRGLRPGMEVREGDRVRLGQTLFRDKRNPDVRFTSPGTGTVSAINRGERRVLQSVVIELDGDDEETFAACTPEELTNLSEQHVRQNLINSGLWTAFRTRPFSKIPAVDATPKAIFVTAIDSNPLAASPSVIIDTDKAAFELGLQLISNLASGSLYLCTQLDSSIPYPTGHGIVHAEFSGPHPAGLVGTHIHFLAPVSETNVVWHIGYQDVMAIGNLFKTGKLPVDRIIALGGPLLTRPRLVRTRLGASTSDLLQTETGAGAKRVISGSVLSGHRAAGWAAYLGRYDNQICVLGEGSKREFLSFMRPGFGKFSSTRSYAAHLFQRENFSLTTTQNGSQRAMVSIGSFEQVMPLDILPTPLLKALLVGDTDVARDLGCLELDEEDLALCSFVCNGKYDYARHLRRNLDDIEVNG